MLKNDYNSYSFAFINLKHLKHNLKIIKTLVKRKTKILIPVKSNAYGCGMVTVSRFLEKEGIDYLGVAFPFEGIILRKKKIKKPILVFSEVIYKDDYDKIIKYNLTPTVFTISSLKKFNQLGKKYNKKINIHINVDTGMGRIGVPHNNIFDFLKTSFLMKNIKIEGVYTHLSSADEKDKTFTLLQLNKFQCIVDFLKKYKRDLLIHVLNSAGIINFPGYSYNMIRPGIMFYGYFPDNVIRKQVKIKPCMNLKAKILFIKKIKENTSISYRHTYISNNSEMIASIGGGYGDGINRLLSSHGHVLYQDRKCPIRGRVCMDQFMIDISKHKKFKIGDLITIFGRDHKKDIFLEDISRQIKTIPYEILCLIGERVQRIYIK